MGIMTEPFFNDETIAMYLEQTLTDSQKRRLESRLASSKELQRIIMLSQKARIHMEHGSWDAVPSELMAKVRTSRKTSSLGRIILKHTGQWMELLSHSLTTVKPVLLELPVRANENLPVKQKCVIPLPMGTLEIHPMKENRIEILLEIPKENVDKEPIVQLFLQSDEKLKMLVSRIPNSSYFLIGRFTVGKYLLSYGKDSIFVDIHGGK